MTSISLGLSIGLLGAIGTCILESNESLGCPKAVDYQVDYVLLIISSLTGEEPSLKRWEHRGVEMDGYDLSCQFFNGTQTRLVLT